MYDAPRARRATASRFSGSLASAFEEARKNLGATGICFVGFVLVGHRVPRPPLGLDLEDRQLPGHAPDDRLRPRAGEERRELVELLALPGVGLVVVALGALDLHAEEDPRDLAGQLDGLGLVGQGEADRAVLVDPAGGRDHRRGDLVPGPVLLELLGQPVFQGVVPHLDRVLVGGVEPDHVAPVPRPVAGELGTLQQRVDQPARLSLVLSLTKKRTCPGVGGAPARSRCTRRTNSTSLVSGAGSTLGFVFLRYCSSIRSRSAEVRVGE